MAIVCLTGFPRCSIGPESAHFQAFDHHKFHQ